MKQVITPYNYVPLWETVVSRYPNQQSLPGHDVLSADLLHGEIRVKITAETPILVSDGESRSERRFVWNGGFMIPGSSLRGLIRTNMQILGFGDIAGSADYRDNPDFGYNFSDLMPSAHRQSETAMDYTRAILGYVQFGKSGKEDKKQKEQKQSISYKSRVSFLNLYAPKIAPPARYEKVYLRPPQPGAKREYTYSDKNGTHMRGVKQYYLSKAAHPRNIGDSKKIFPLPAGTVFTGSIRYHNLHEDELGLLLWCLRLEKGCFQSLGMAKPYGFGRVKIEIAGLTEHDPGKLYADLCVNPAGSGAERVDALIRAYRRYAWKLLHPQEEDASGDKLLEAPHIQDFLYLKRTVYSDPKQVRYMTEAEFAGADLPMATTAELRKTGKK